jgi:hypothetical protein
MKNCLVCILDSIRYDIVDRDCEDGILNKINLIEKVDTPNLDRLVETGVSVPNMHAPWPGTPPSVASILTGLYPREHGVFASAKAHSIFPKVSGLEKQFAEGGYHTIFWTDFLQMKRVLRAEERFDEIEKGPMKKLIARIKKLNRDGKKVFVLMHTDDTHGSYMMSHYPPTENYHDRAIKWANSVSRLCKLNKNWTRKDALAPSDESGIDWESDRHFPVWKFQRDLQVKNPDWLEELDPNSLFQLLATMYVEGINHYDKFQLKELTDFLTEDPDGQETTTVITSDHGQTLRQRSGSTMPTFYHSGKPVQDLIRIPAIWVNSPLKQEQINRWKVTSSVDLAPTITDIFKFKQPQEVSGQNLGEKPPDNRRVYTEFSKTSPQRKQPPRFSVLSWNAVITSDGLKYYQPRPKIKEKDYQAPIDEFLFRCFYKIEGVLYDEGLLEPLVEQFEKNDTRRIRKMFVQNLKENSEKQNELYKWKEDHDENNNLLESEPEKWTPEAKKLDRNLNSRFDNMFEHQRIPEAFKVLEPES